MKFLFVPSNQNEEWPHKKEYIDLRTKLGFDGFYKFANISHRALDNFLWFFKFELSFREKDAISKRDEIKEVE